MTGREAIEKLKACQTNTNTEEAHRIADQVLCDLLIELGYGDVVDQWEEVYKWYA